MIAVSTANWSKRVERWNRGSADERRHHATICAHDGHRWVASPTVVFCDRCLAISPDEPNLRADGAPTVRPPGAPTNEELARIARLSPARYVVAQSIGRGQSNKEIAAELFVSEQTVKNHVTAILRTLKVNDRVGIARLMIWHDVLVYFAAREVIAARMDAEAA